MSFERYVDYALDVPMYFVYRDGRYIDVGRRLVPRFPRRHACRSCRANARPMDDWSDHLTTLFPEVRMKRFLEMRGADGGRWRRICALPAFWTGPALRPDLARCGLGPRQGLDAPRSGRRCATRCRGRRSRTPFRTHDACSRSRAAGAGDRPGGPAAPRLRQRQGRGREHLPRAGRGDPAQRPHAGRGDPAALRARLGPPAPPRSSASMPSDCRAAEAATP